MVWASLDEAARTWLIEHNGEALPPTMIGTLLGAAGDATWLDRDDSDGPMLTDDVVDWIEAIANNE